MHDVSGRLHVRDGRIEHDGVCSRHVRDRRQRVVYDVSARYAVHAHGRRRILMRRRSVRAGRRVHVVPGRIVLSDHIRRSDIVLGRLVQRVECDVVYGMLGRIVVHDDGDDDVHDWLVLARPNIGVHDLPDRIQLQLGVSAADGVRAGVLHDDDGADGVHELCGKSVLSDYDRCGHVMRRGHIQRGERHRVHAVRAGHDVRGR